MPTRFLLLGAAMSLVALLAASAQDDLDETAEDDHTSAMEQASCHGKYRVLLHTIDNPGDVDRFGRFHDAGFGPPPARAGDVELPEAYWVYVDPHWYLWRDSRGSDEELPDQVVQFEGVPRAWGPEQAIGEPDTDGPGDIRTAWASATQDAQDEWLLLTYDEPIQPEAILVYETFNPGALTHITAFDMDVEVVIWEGVDPTTRDRAEGVSIVHPRRQPFTSMIRLYFDSTGVEGWNEIDAVGIRDVKGNTHWAVATAASTTYAER